jgi:hypothetical protein
MKGYLTGDARTAVVPEAGSTLDFSFSKVEFEHYRADFTPTTHMTIVSGAVSFDVQVHLGKSRSTGLCKVPMPNLTFRNIRFASDLTTRVVLVSEENGINGLILNIDGSDMHAQAGFGDSAEQDNRLGGHLTLFNQTFAVPTDGLGLSPDPEHAALFNVELHKLSDLDFQGRAHLYSCDSFERVRALNVARLLVLNVGSITQESHDEYLKGDVHAKDSWWLRFRPNCGFSSYLTRAFPKQVIRKENNASELHFRIDSCEVVKQVSTGFYPEDCLGEKTAFEGKAIVTGTQKVRGRLQSFLGMFDDIVPSHPHANVFDFEKITVDRFASYYTREGDDQPQAKLLMSSGEFSAQIKPVLAPKKGSPCEFSRSTPVVGFEIQVKDKIVVELTLNTQGLQYARTLNLRAASLKAQNGYFRGQGNFLTGDITLDGNSFHFEGEALNPDYDQTKFDQSYECRERFPKTNDYSIEHIIPFWEGWNPDCPN